MADPLTTEEKIDLLKQAQKAWEAAKSKEDAAAVLKRFGQGGVGWRPACRVLIGGQSIEQALKLNK